MALRVPRQEEEFGNWRAEPHPFTIEYSFMVLEELRLHAEEGFQKIPHGGLEVGALLLGTFEGGAVRILEWRAIECEHAGGPGFVLSEKDQAGLADQIQDCASAPELRGLIPVGWFHTHTRSGLFFSPEDRAVHQRLFPERWQIAMVLRLAKDQPPLAGFFVTEPDGHMRCESSYMEFGVRANPTMLLRPRRASAAPRPEPDAKPQTPPQHERRPMGVRQSWWDTPPTPPRMVADSYAAPAPAPLPLHPPPADVLSDLPTGKFRWRLLVTVALMLLVIAGAVITRKSWMGATEPPLALRLEEVEDQLIIRWDLHSPAARQADRGALEINDGGVRHEIPLDEVQARSGSVTFIRQSEDVQVHLTLQAQGREPAREFARFLGGPVKSRLATELEQTEMEKEQLNSDVERLRQALKEETSRTQRLRGSVKNLESQLKQAPRP